MLRSIVKLSNYLHITIQSKLFFKWHPRQVPLLSLSNYYWNLIAYYSIKNTGQKNTTKQTHPAQLCIMWQNMNLVFWFVNGSNSDQYLKKKGLAWADGTFAIKHNWKKNMEIDILGLFALSRILSSLTRSLIGFILHSLLYCGHDTAHYRRHKLSWRSRYHIR